ncbi:hypothetical protein [Candidatus Thiodiazotropha sp. CDECU1]|uniref:hypothetical protein n=1 Tax=Candidatus Thiodiazotropha sp. CDECU1 TaxID=3065865 RepID=UPI00292FFBA6|nr:hypothetical protein [Candidatus Thiodiazotropha sp. CDECU1]
MMTCKKSVLFGVVSMGLAELLAVSLIVTTSLMFSACSEGTNPPQTTSVPLNNPSFEQSDQYLEGWGFSQHAGKPAYAVSIDTTNSTDGNNSYRIERELVQSWGMIYQWLPLDNAMGKTIKLTAMIKSENLGPDGFDLNLVFRKANRKVISNIASEAVTGTNNWQRISVTGVIPANTAQLQITAVLNDAGTAWVDDVQVSITDKN